MRWPEEPADHASGGFRKRSAAVTVGHASMWDTSDSHRFTQVRMVRCGYR
jgi:hypothetical protein